MKKTGKSIIFCGAVAVLYVLYKKLYGKFQYDKAKEQITVKKGGTLELTFPWNISTGPSEWWTFDNKDEIDIVKKVGEMYKSTSPAGMYSGGGYMTMKWKAIKKGTQTMHWTKGKGTERETVRTIGIHVW